MLPLSGYTFARSKEAPSAAAKSLQTGCANACPGLSKKPVFQACPCSERCRMAAAKAAPPLAFHRGRPCPRRKSPPLARPPFLIAPRSCAGGAPDACHGQDRLHVATAMTGIFNCRETTSTPPLPATPHRPAMQAGASRQSPAASTATLSMHVRHRRKYRRTAWHGHDAYATSWWPMASGSCAR